MSSEQRLQPSDEVDERHLELARQAGDAYQRAAEHMASEVAETGEIQQEGDYVVGFAQEEAEGLYRLRDGDLEWATPTEGDNCHLQVLVASSADGRFLPGVDVRATLEPEDGEAAGPVEVPLVWHPGLYHYGVNLSVPGEATYTITVEADAPAFPRHDEQNGERFGVGLEARFEGVEIETGRKAG